MGNDNIKQAGQYSDLHDKFIEGIEQSSLTSKNAREINNQIAVDGKLLDLLEDNTAAGATKKSTKLERSENLKTEKAKKAQESVLVRKDEADGLADEFSKRQGNREYRIDRILLSQLLAEELGAGIHENSTPDEIIFIIRKRMSANGELPDVAIVDKAFQFLVEASKNQIDQSTETGKIRLEKILNKLEIAKDKHFESHSVEIQVAEKIIGAVDAVVETTGQTVKETLDRYRDVVHNPPELQTLRKFYEEKGYKAMIQELKGLNTYLGGNLKRSNLENPEISQLASAARKMQALLGVFRLSRSRLPTMESYLTLNRVLVA